ncbi:MAG: site-2 protease family protein, partial [Abditibacteriota bacterium]|nr:site-2 protease family protein [Abditibacteriota bacterium]
AFIVIICLLVVAHEYGHFLLARIFDVKVLEFSVGFGPRLFTYLKKNGTDFNVRCIPLGGFVRMSGEDPAEMDVEGGFQSKPAYARAAVIFAGPFFSFLFAVAVFMLLGYVWGLPDGSDNSVQMTMPGTPAAEMDLRAGDRVLSVNGKALSKPGELVEEIRKSEGEVTLVIDRKGRTLTKTGVPNLTLRYYMGGNWEQEKGSVKLTGFIKETPLEKAGADSALVEMNGRKFTDTGEFWRAAPEKGEKVTLTLHSGYDKKEIRFTAREWCGRFCGQEIIFPSRMFISPRPSEGKWWDTGNILVSVNGVKITGPEDIEKALLKKGCVIEYTDPENLIHKTSLSGASFEPLMGIATPVLGFIPGYHLKKTGLAESMKTGLESVWNMIRETLKILFSRAVKDNLGGPVAIVSMTNSAVNSGVFSIIILAGGLSLSLAIFNLLPIPPLDGGHLFVILLETLRRKRFAKEQLIKIQTAGVMVMILIFVLVIGLDVYKLITGAMPK